MTGKRDTVVPLANAEYLHQRLPRSELDVIDAGHFTWEDSNDEYASLVTTWWRRGYTAAELKAEAPTRRMA